MGRDSNKRNIIIARIVIDIVLFLSAILSPWIITVIIAIYGTLLIPRFYEFVIAGLIIDLLYGAQVNSFYNFQYMFLVSSIAAFMILEYLKRFVRVYST